ncbi:hypothetical protein CJ030_MR1G028870 [Morella rubra]|uniref:Uncharacterized protein n=1 Tax=Morella rubra TaxID=262757 RepID=A0A6A1WUN7_9ROSI|nr:hypothetical protein CJ030_MR1G028870 [Morella rubra]
MELFGCCFIFQNGESQPGPSTTDPSQTKRTRKSASQPNEGQTASSTTDLSQSKRKRKSASQNAKSQHPPTEMVRVQYSEDHLEANGDRGHCILWNN